MTCKCGRPMQHEYGIWWRCDRCGDWDMTPMEQVMASALKPLVATVVAPARPHASGHPVRREEVEAML